MEEGLNAEGALIVAASLAEKKAKDRRVRKRRGFWE